MIVKKPLFFLFFLSGCTVGPVYKTPEMEVPSSWHSAASPRFECAPFEGMIWWEELNDPVLNELMAYAAFENLDLKIAAIRVLQARLEGKAKKADLYPHIDASASYGHVYYSKDALVNGLIGNVSPVKSHINRNVNFYEAGFDADWEIDLFGLTAHEVAALKAKEQGVQERLCGVWVTLSAEIAKNYIELRGEQNRLEIAKQNVKLGEEALALTHELFERGIVNESDYLRAEADAHLLKGALPLMELNIAGSIHRISILLGLAPGELYECLSPKSAVPELPANILVGIPSELLQRRPDVRRAERELAEATERIGTAVASLFPRFSLYGFIGEISTHAGSLFSPSSATWLSGLNVLVPLFNSRLVLQDVEFNKLETKQALYAYQKTVLEALEEAETAIASFKHEEEHFQRMTKARDLYREGLALDMDLRERGINDSFALIKAKKTILASDDSAMQAEVKLLLTYVALSKALGGSFYDCFQPPAQAENTEIQEEEIPAEVPIL